MEEKFTRGFSIVWCGDDPPLSLKSMADEEAVGF